MPDPQLALRLALKSVLLLIYKFLIIIHMAKMMLCRNLYLTEVLAVVGISMTSAQAPIAIGNNNQ